METLGPYLPSVPHLVRRWAQYILGGALLLLILRHIAHSSAWEPIGGTFPGRASSFHRIHKPQNHQPLAKTVNVDKPFKWSDVPLLYPPHRLHQLPTASTRRIPEIQYDFKKKKSLEDPMDKAERARRLSKIKDAFMHSWDGYKKYAWGHDELLPVIGAPRDSLGGWGATLVDSLDTLWLMDMRPQFVEALAEVEKIDYSRCSLQEVSIFETTIRHLGGLLGAYDVTNGKFPILLTKAVEVGDLIYKAFDTPNGMPITRWNWRKAAQGEDQHAPADETIAEFGSLTLELTRLTQITKDQKYYDAAQRIADVLFRHQKKTKLPGMWPLHVNPRDEDFSRDSSFSLGALSDSTYEYLPKQYILLNGRTAEYGSMFLNAMERIKSFLAFEPLLPITSVDDLSREPLLLGTARVSGTSSAMVVNLDPRGEHLACFAGGMVALGARALATERAAAATIEDMTFAAQLTQGCVWSYLATATGIGPEVFHTLPCRKGRDAVTRGREPDWTGKHGNCTWDEVLWLRNVMHKTKQDADDENGTNEEVIEGWKADVEQRHVSVGFTDVSEPKYILRPEAIESLFVLYRLTGEEQLRDQAWKMFENIVALTRTDKAFGSVADVTKPVAKKSKLRHQDLMESFWMAETLKYFYLMFADYTLCNLDEFVFNTEAHPFRYRTI